MGGIGATLRPTKSLHCDLLGLRSLLILRILNPEYWDVPACLMSSLVLMLLDAYRVQNGLPLHSLSRHGSAQCGCLHRGRTRQLRMASECDQSFHAENGQISDMPAAQYYVLGITWVTVETVLAMSADGRSEKSPVRVRCPLVCGHLSKSPVSLDSKPSVAPHNKPIADLTGR